MAGPGHRARRGELCALRWPDINEDEEDLLIGGSYAVKGGRKMVKQTKTHRKRRLALDPGTLELLADYREHCRKAAAAAGVPLGEDGFIFSADGAGRQPWNPDTISRWFAKITDAAGVDTTLHGLRHYNATQMLSSGIDIRTAAGRLGHEGGGTMTLRVYAHRTRPATSEPRSFSLSSCVTAVGARRGRRHDEGPTLLARVPRGCERVDR